MHGSLATPLIIAGIVRLPRAHWILPQVHCELWEGGYPSYVPLKQEALAWTDETELAFNQLKQALMATPLLQMPNFSKCFIVDCDTSRTGFGTMLHQGDGVISFFS
jgi:hypothetical protein